MLNYILAFGPEKILVEALGYRQYHKRQYELLQDVDIKHTRLLLAGDAQTAFDEAAKRIGEILSREPRAIDLEPTQ